MKKLLLCMVMAACAAHAAKVSSVSVKLADGGEDTGDVLARCMVKAGDEYDPQQCARDVRTLRDTNEFEDIAVKANQAADGVSVVYVVTRKKRFQGPLNVKGNDYYMLLADLRSYCDAQDRVDATYRDAQKWNAMSLVNIARSGRFSSDRAVAEYAQEIWHVEPVNFGN